MQQKLISVGCFLSIKFFRNGVFNLVTLTFQYQCLQTPYNFFFISMIITKLKENKMSANKINSCEICHKFKITLCMKQNRFSLALGNGQFKQITSSNFIYLA